MFIKSNSMNKKLKIGASLCIVVCLSAFYQIKNNHLTKEEKAEGWTLLFDGQTVIGWHAFQKPTTMNPQWKVEDGTLTLMEKGGGDIVTNEEYENFELNLEWKISKNGNSGIFFNVSEDGQFDAPWKTGPEMQILDNEGHPDGKFPKHTAGASYDLAVPLVNSARAVGEWNHVRIIVDQGKVTYNLNGQVTAKFELWTTEWDNLVLNSKFTKYSKFGMIRKGKICLQDHGDRVWFRNIKIKKL